MQAVTLDKKQTVDQKSTLSRKLTVIARHLRNRFDQSVNELGVTRSQWMLIAAVSSRPGLTQRTIAEILEISEAAAGRLIDRLCAEGLLERKARSDDRRAYSVYVTDGAVRQMEAWSEIARQHENETFSGLNGEQLQQLEELLGLVYTNVTARCEPGRP